VIAWRQSGKHINSNPMKTQGLVNGTTLNGLITFQGVRDLTTGRGEEGPLTEGQAGLTGCLLSSAVGKNKFHSP